MPLYYLQLLFLRFLKYFLTVRMLKNINSAIFAFDENVCATSPLSPKKNNSVNIEKDNKVEVDSKKYTIKKVDSDPFFFQ